MFLIPTSQRSRHSRSLSEAPRPSTPGSFRALLRDEVGLTVEKPDEIDDELRYLCAALSATT